MAIITVNDLNNLTNKIVVDFMGKGYVLSNFTHGGGYTSTEFHLDMIKPNDKSHIIRIWMINSHADIEHRIYSHINTAAIRVSKYTRKDGYDGNSHKSQTLWADRGEVINEHKFYQICEGKNGNVYTDNLDEAIKAINMQFDRRRSHVSKRCYSHSVEICKLPSSFIDGIMHRINTIRGFKRATASCLTKVIVGKDYGGKMAADVYFSQNGKDGIIKLR